MNDRKIESQEQRQAGLAPETHNDEQDEHLTQAQEVAEDARHLTEESGSPTESVKGPGKSGVMDDSSQDLIDRMKDQESSGRIDMGAYRGEPNMDDNEDKYGQSNKLDDLPSDGSGHKSQGPRD